jgi:hypothetical protein
MTDKYPRTYHFPFSPGKSSDDKVLHNWQDCIKDKNIMYTEKLDGGNTQITKEGVFARSVSMPTDHPSFDHLKAKWSTIRYDLDDLVLFGENMFAIHSIEYTDLESYFYIFGAKNKDKWLSWEEVCFYAQLFEWPTVPVLTFDMNKTVEQNILHNMSYESALGGPKEGVVVRNRDEFPLGEFSSNIIKYVRKDHVQTDQHWTKNWRQAKLWGP